ncbi:MAG: hypothetical protein DWQ45_17935 [Planctomycetota bacterium]|nr:MAG: hypothetical protein DWQ41_09945 [Planctomycetota bacterium]REK32046.1 MAG: hypothetical protein DWQ45_17935 [Planctomycetota bacterium]
MIGNWCNNRSHTHMMCRQFQPLWTVVATCLLAVSLEPVCAQERPGTARVPGAQSGSPPARQAQAESGTAPRVERPAADTIQQQLPAGMDELLLKWERESARIERLRGDVTRFVYDSVYLVEERSVGKFWYESVDKGRMDFKAVKLPDPPVSRDKQGANGKPYTLESGANERWICNGKEIFLIHDDNKLYDLVRIPPQQQGRNIINGPLPFLFGMKAEQAKARYGLDYGKLHRPEERIVQTKEGKRVRLPVQYHIIATPRTRVDAAEWSRAEVLMYGSFIPKAIRLLNPTGEKETVYAFSEMKVNEKIWINNPFNDRPPSSYTLDNNNRAAAEQPVDPTRPIVPTGGERERR